MGKGMGIEASKSFLVAATLTDMFFRPWIAMLAWGAFLHMSKVNLPSFGYWEVFMLNCVCLILTSSRITKWKIVQPAEEGR